MCCGPTGFAWGPGSNRSIWCPTLGTSTNNIAGVFRCSFPGIGQLGCSSFLKPTAVHVAQLTCDCSRSCFPRHGCDPLVGRFVAAIGLGYVVKSKDVGG